MSSPAYAIKVRIDDLRSMIYPFEAQKTMYGGKHIAPGDLIFIFSSGREDGSGLFACGLVRSAKSVARRPGIARQTPRVGIDVEVTAQARRRLGRNELKGFSRWEDGRPETELNLNSTGRRRTRSWGFPRLRPLSWRPSSEAFPKMRRALDATGISTKVRVS